MSFDVDSNSLFVLQVNTKQCGCRMCPFIRNHLHVFEALFQSTFQFYLVVEKKKNLNEQNFYGDANWPGVVNFHNHCIQMSLNYYCYEHAVFLFSDD